MSDRYGVGPVRYDDDAIDVARHEERRIVERGGVLLDLNYRLFEVLVFAFIFPSEAALSPNVGPTISAACLGRALLERIGISGWVGVVGFGFAEEVAEVIEVGLGGGSFGLGNRAPLVNKLLG